MNRLAWQKRKVVVTGANGFIGSSLVRKLAEVGAETYALVREKCPWRLKDVEGNLVLETIDLNDQVSIEKFYQRIQPSITFHTAAYGVNHSDQDIVRAVNVNILGGLNLLMASCSISGHRLINLGTRYESAKNRGSLKETDPQDPMGMYGTTKYAAQMIMEDFARRMGQTMRTAMLFGVYGPMEREEKFIPYVITSLLQGVAPRLSGCEQARDYTYIDDAVQALLMLAEMEEPGILKMNVGSGESVSLRQIVECIEKIVRSGVKIDFGVLPYRQDEIWHLIPDLEFSRKLLNWSPGISLENGLKKTVDWYRSRAGINGRKSTAC